jgi:hypothetical protein
MSLLHDRAIEVARWLIGSCFAVPFLSQYIVTAVKLLDLSGKLKETISTQLWFDMFFSKSGLMAEVLFPCCLKISFACWTLEFTTSFCSSFDRRANWASAANRRLSRNQRENFGRKKQQNNSRVMLQTTCARELMLDNRGIICRNANSSKHCSRFQRPGRSGYN